MGMQNKDNEKEAQNGHRTLLQCSGNREDDLHTHHTDSGWAWVIMMGYFTHLFIFIGVTKSFGLFYVEFLREYYTTSTMLSVMITIQNLVSCLASLFVLNFCVKRYENRPMVCLGGLLHGVAYVLNAYTHDIIGLIICQGIIFGTSLSLGQPLINVELNKYFDKKRGFATMIGAIGGASGSLVFPIIIRTLLDTYGLDGALLIVGGINLNTIVIGALLRPFSENSNKTLNDVRKNITKSEDEILDTDTSTFSSCSPLTENKSLSKNNIASQYPKSGSIKKPFDKSIEILTNFGSTSTIHSASGFKSQTKASISCCSKLFDFSLLKNRHLLFILGACLLSVSGCGLIGMYIPHFAKDNDVQNDEVAILVTILGACALCSRLILALIIDYVRLNIILGFCLVVTGISTMCNPFYTTYHTFIVYSLFYGLVGSVYFGCSPLLIRQCVESKKYPAALSMHIVINGLALMGVTPVLGYIRDVTGSYTVSFYIMGVGLLIGSLIIFLEPIIKRYTERRKNVTNDTPDTL